jgi:hypothetical protein
MEFIPRNVKHNTLILKGKLRYREIKRLYAHYESQVSTLGIQLFNPVLFALDPIARVESAYYLYV